MLNSLKHQVTAIMKQIGAQSGLSQTWENLSIKDRKVLIVLAWLLGGALLYFVIWQPIAQENQKAKSQLQVAQQEWLWLTQQVPKVASHSSQTSPVKLTSQTQLTRYLQQTLRQMNLSQALQEIKPQQVAGKAAIQVRFKTVSAPRFFRWLSKMEKSGLVANRLTATPIADGKLAIQVTFLVMQ